ncbi:hypothetical protein [Acidovorax sp. RAC01]|uniref:hypothetical protein n=1 Tax=Acidovorax sp. RAC01 TaxID=1842533 RepID=UPI0018D2D10E|nr:hypothetical protein [Acidovorax sp. RAC01]
MQIKDRPGGAVLLSLTSDANGGITLDDAGKVIEIVIRADQTEAMTWTSGAYDLELVSPGGVVTALPGGCRAGQLRNHHPHYLKEAHHASSILRACAQCPPRCH